MGLFTRAVASLQALATPRHKYRAIPAPVSDRHTAQQLSYAPPPRSRYSKISMVAMLLAVFVFLGLAFARDRRPETTPCVDKGRCTHDTQKHWGQYSPYFSAPHDSISPDVPSECKVVFASVLSRHGSRFPTTSKSKAYKLLVERIQKDVKSYGKGYEFIKSYKYKLGANDLTSHGEEEMVNSGKHFLHRYKKLAKEVTHPFVRASGSKRVILSARRFVQGFYKAKGIKNGDKYLPDILVIPEGDGFNNTLDHGSCKAFEQGPDAKLGHKMKDAWRKTWAAPIRERLNKKLPGANMSLEDTVNFMDLCPFDTVASRKAKTISQFCRLFSEDEWHGYEYYESLDKWYRYGPGNPLGPTQGVGYVNELIARLTHSPVKDHTSTNQTLDQSPTTFPINRLLYADFTHDNTMLTIYGALGLFSNSTHLPTDRVTSPREADGFSASWTVPFAARMYVERMRCNTDRDLIRVLIDDRVVAPKNCKADKLGRCEAKDFLKGLDFAVKGGLWNQCGK